MATVYDIKDRWENQGQSLRAIARKLKLNFRTVRKCAHMEISSPVGLGKQESTRGSKLDAFKPAIDGWLRGDAKLPRKRRQNTERIFERLRGELGYTGGKTIVKDYVRLAKRMLSALGEGFMATDSPKGWGQVDFGEVHYLDASGKEQKGQLLVVVFPFSNKGYAQLCPTTSMECLCDGLRRVFERIGGVPPRLLFDNLPAAVKKVGPGKHRDLTDGFMSFQMCYRFQADFCDPAAPNQKGCVENKVKYLRNHVFSPMPTVTSFEEFNSFLFEWCDKNALRNHYRHEVPIQDLWEHETTELLALPDNPFQAFTYRTCTVDKRGYVVIETNSYGLPAELHGEEVQAKIYWDRVEFLYDHRPLATYQRSYGRKKLNSTWVQHLGIMRRKPGGIRFMRGIEDMPGVLRHLLVESPRKEVRHALDVLIEMRDNGHIGLCEDVIKMAAGVGKLDADTLKQAYYVCTRRPPDTEPLALSKSVPVANYNPDLSVYDRLAGGANHA